MPTIIDCVDVNGIVTQFQYEIDVEDDGEDTEWTFRVTQVDNPSVYWYEFKIKKVDQNTGKVVMMNNHGRKEYRGKGITEKMIEEANSILSLDIISSTNIQEYKDFDDEFITIAAEKVWERLVEQGRAERDEVSRIFRFIPQNNIT